MKRRFKYGFSLFSFSCFVLLTMFAQIPHPSPSLDDLIVYSPAPYNPPKVLFDYFHHALPSTKVGNHILTGSWIDDNGRYGWNDFVHTNTFDHVYILLEDDYQISMCREPYSEKLLSQADIVVIMHLDNPDYIPDVKALSDEEIKQLKKYVENGGSLMVMLNAGGHGRTHEGFEQKQLQKLVRGFGLYWNDDDTHYSDNKINDGHPYFYDVTNFHYGAGCTLNILENASNPEILLHVYSDSTYTDRCVKGPGIILVRPGKGKFMLVGDVGSWTGNMSRPWVDNAVFFKQLFLYLKPDNGVKPPQFQKDKTWKYELQVSGLQAIPVANSLSQIELPFYKKYSPREITNMPYFEKSADLELCCKDNASDLSAQMEVKINGVKWFDEHSLIDDEQLITFTSSRQGKISNVETMGYEAQWFAPDITTMVALLPVDGVCPGDRWKSKETLRIPNLRGSDLPPVRTYEMEIKYARDVKLNGIDCRLLQSSGEIWLDELGVTLDDLLPLEEIRQIGGTSYTFFSPHGGKLLFKREQWVDASSGMVLKATNQIRIIAWIQDTRKPVALRNVDKDNEMIISLAYISNLRLK